MAQSTRLAVLGLAVVITAAAAASMMALPAAAGSRTPATSAGQLPHAGVTFYGPPGPYVIQVAFRGRRALFYWLEGATFSIRGVRANYGGTFHSPMHDDVILGRPYRGRNGDCLITLAIPVPVGRPITPEAGFQVRYSQYAPGWFQVGPARAIARSAVQLDDHRCPFLYDAEWDQCIQKLWAGDRRMVPVP